MSKTCQNKVKKLIVTQIHNYTKRPSAECERAIVKCVRCAYVYARRVTTFCEHTLATVQIWPHIICATLRAPSISEHPKLSRNTAPQRKTEQAAAAYRLPWLGTCASP